MSSKVLNRRGVSDFQKYLPREYTEVYLWMEESRLWMRVRLLESTADLTRWVNRQSKYRLERGFKRVLAIQRDCIFYINFPELPK